MADAPRRPGDDTDDEVARLRAAGALERAAARARADGEPLRAAALLAEAWRHDDAVALALDAGRPDVAYRLALGSLDRGLAARVLPRFEGRPELAAAAAALALARERPSHAAVLLEHAGDLAGAAARHEALGELVEAGRLREAAGQPREAGALYERALRLAPDDGEAGLRLGRLLVSLGQPDRALVPLQVAARDDTRRGGALRWLVAAFDALGLAHAAGRCLASLRAADPSLPATVPEYLAESFGGDGPAPPAGLAPADALVAGRYRVGPAVGEGATGRVSAAHDLLLDRPVALKVLTVGAGGAGGRDAFERFVREARLAGSLDHPHVVRVVDFDPAGPTLVMEWMAGGTLADRLAAAAGRVPPLPRAVARQVGRGVLRALEAVHRRGIVHRDLKAANVFFDGAGGVKLGDFGAAHLADLGATWTGAMLGSLATMAPEQITGRAAPSAATDLYAFGVVAFQTWTGRLPFPGPDLVTQHLERAPDRPSAHVPGLPAAFDDLVAALLDKDPGRRPSSAAEVLAAFEALPWDRFPDEGAPPGAAVGTPAPAAEQAPEPAAAARYEPTGEADVWLDRGLGRRVRVVRGLDAGAAARLRAFARADHPHLQAVLDLDEGRALLELPAGATPAAALPAEARAALADALRRVHAEGLVHGAVTREAVRVGPHRTVLLVAPAPPPPTATPDDDLAALARLCADEDDVTAPRP